MFKFMQRSAHLAPGVMLALMVCAGIVDAQENPAVKPAAAIQGEAPDAKPEKTRARRVAPPVIESPAAQVEKGSAQTVKDQNSQPTSDPETRALRDQIDAATPEERPGLQLQLVDQLIKTGRKSDAVVELHSLAAADRFDPTGLYNVGNRLARLDDAEGAISAYRKAIDQRKGNYSRALNNLGAVQMRAGHSDDAFNSLSAALRLENFRYAEASYNLGRLYATGGLTDLAIREWRRALAVDPQNAAAAQALANAGVQSVTVARSPLSKNEPVAANRQVNTSISTGRSLKPPTAAAASAALTLDQSSYDLLQRARNARDRGRNDEAVQTYRTLLAHTGGYFAPANLELGYALITLQRTDEAITALQPVATRDGARFPFAYYHLARIYEQRNELKLAEENYVRAAVAYQNGNSQFLLDVSRVREKSGDLTGALAAFEQYVQATTQAGHKPDWSEEHLAALRGKLASQTSPKP